MGLLEDSWLSERVHQWSGPQGDLHAAAENCGKGLVGVLDRPREWKEDWRSGAPPDPEEAVRLRGGDPSGRRVEPVENDGGMAADRKAEDHFGRREKRQEGAPP